MINRIISEGIDSIMLVGNIENKLSKQTNIIDATTTTSNIGSLEITTKTLENEMKLNNDNGLISLNVSLELFILKKCSNNLLSLKTEFSKDASRLKNIIGDNKIQNIKYNLQNEKIIHALHQHHGHVMIVMIIEMDFANIINDIMNVIIDNALEDIKDIIMEDIMEDIMNDIIDNIMDDIMNDIMDAIDYN